MPAALNLQRYRPRALYAERDAAIRIATGEGGFQAYEQQLEKLRPSRLGYGEGGGELRGRTRRPHESIIHCLHDRMVPADRRSVTVVMQGGMRCTRGVRTIGRWNPRNANPTTLAELQTRRSQSGYSTRRLSSLSRRAIRCRSSPRSRPLALATIRLRAGCGLPASEKGRGTPRVGWEGRKPKSWQRCCRDGFRAARPRYRCDIAAQRPHIDRRAADSGEDNKHRRGDEPWVLEERCGPGGHAIIVVAIRAPGVSGPAMLITVAISVQGRSVWQPPTASIAT
jgi:hypothetical protein